MVNFPFEAKTPWNSPNLANSQCCTEPAHALLQSIANKMGSKIKFPSNWQQKDMVFPQATPLQTQPRKSLQFSHWVNKIE